MDNESKRRALIAHVRMLKEMDFVCLEPPAGGKRESIEAGAVTPVAEAMGRSSAPASSPSAFAPSAPAPRLAPVSSALPIPAAMASNWPACLFTSPDRPPLRVVNPPMSANTPKVPAPPPPPPSAPPVVETPDLFESSTPVPAPPRAAAPESATAESAPVLSYPERVERLSAIAREVAACRNCCLCQERTHVVPGQGNPMSPLVFVGEGPGADEDEQGLAFVGRAGRLLGDIIKAMQLTRDDVFICNVVKCRPPGNRTPAPDEMTACEPFLKRQLEIIRPSVIVALGAVALRCLLRDNRISITKIRGHWHAYEGIPMMPTFHPAYLLRNPPEKKWVWEDMKQVMHVFGLKPK